MNPDTLRALAKAMVESQHLVDAHAAVWDALFPFLRHAVNCPSRGMPEDQVLHSCTCGLAEYHISIDLIACADAWDADRQRLEAAERAMRKVIAHFQSPWRGGAYEDHKARECLLAALAESEQA